MATRVKRKNQMDPARNTIAARTAKAIVTVVILFMKSGATAAVEPITSPKRNERAGREAP